MKSKPTPKPSRSARLIRNRSIFEFLVRYPHGSSAIAGYRRAARHFGLHTKDDPTFEGSDAYRLFIHRNARKLRAIAKAIEHANAITPDDTIYDVENDLFDEAQVTYFTQDWRFWDIPADESALENLGWKRYVLDTTYKSGNQVYCVTLNRSARRRPNV